METIKYSGEFFNIEDTLSCGQTFRFKKYLNGYLVISTDKICYLYDSDGYVFMETEHPEYFSNYFDLNCNYEKIVSSAYAFNNEFLTKAVNYGKGIRILRQNCEETLYHFMISQNNNIPRIKSSIEKLSTNYGEKINSPFGEFYAFPSSKKIKALSVNDLKDVGLGYRAEYFSLLADKITGGLNLSDYENLDAPDLYKKLISIKGVGDKVANCVILFGYHKTASFPVDTWIEKIYLEDLKGNLTDRKKISEYFIKEFGENSGYVQQYLFHYKRNGKL